MIELKTLREWITSLATLGLLCVALYGLFLSESIFSLQKDIVALKAEKATLAKNRNEYIKNIQPAIIGNLISKIKADYENNLTLCEKGRELEKLHIWIKSGAPRLSKKMREKIKKEAIKSFEEKNKNRYFSSATKNIIIRANSMGVKHWFHLVPESFRGDWFGNDLNRWTTDGEKTLSSVELYQKQKNHFDASLTGIDLINKSKKVISSSSLSQTDKRRLNLFLDKYIESKISTYKLEAKPTWNKRKDLKVLRQHAVRVEGNLIKMKEDLPALKLALEKFFEENLITNNE